MDLPTILLTSVAPSFPRLWFSTTVFTTVFSHERDILVIPPSPLLKSFHPSICSPTNQSSWAGSGCTCPWILLLLGAFPRTRRDATLDLSKQHASLMPSSLAPPLLSLLLLDDVDDLPLFPALSTAPWWSTLSSDKNCTEQLTGFNKSHTFSKQISMKEQQTLYSAVNINSLKRGNQLRKQESKGLREYWEKAGPKTSSKTSPACAERPKPPKHQCATSKIKCPRFSSLSHQH